MPSNLFVSAHLPHFKPPRSSDTNFGNTNLLFNPNKLQLFKNIKGLKWGNFIASPDADFFNPTPNFVYLLPKNQRFFLIYLNNFS